MFKKCQDRPQTVSVFVLGVNSLSSNVSGNVCIGPLGMARKQKTVRKQWFLIPEVVTVTCVSTKGYICYDKIRG